MFLPTDRSDIMVVPRRFSTTVSTKGQVILPKPVRDQFRWTSGTRLIVDSIGDGVLLKAEAVFPPTLPKDVFGSLPRHGGPKTVAEMRLPNETETEPRHARDR
jgi:AbrB family looped-hinge helix DNA binding protein